MRAWGQGRGGAEGRLVAARRGVEALKSETRNPKTECALLARADCVADADGAGADYFGEDTLAAVQHQGAQALTNGIHLRAGVARGVEAQNGTADFDLTTHEGDQVDARGLDVGADGARGDGREAERDGVFGNLFAFNQGHLPAGRLAGVAAEAAEIAGVPLTALACDKFDGLDGLQGCAGLRGVQVERGDMAG